MNSCLSFRGFRWRLSVLSRSLVWITISLIVCLSRFPCLSQPYAVDKVVNVSRLRPFGRIVCIKSLLKYFFLINSHRLTKLQSKTWLAICFFRRYVAFDMSVLHWKCNLRIHHRFLYYTFFYNEPCHQIKTYSIFNEWIKITFPNLIF